ncbi:uncharacterized protein RSE6_13754 [Rhynchosporium secalis]|uniref:Uncharacterized protein n=1 Tax=Rhynchosporium secalis TaxID=38038 RepID=A0A1E1MTN2_RHYSE|nr:uncharacterized protein RSE6_13754 [Rhynchosporium secalis]
MLYQATVSDMDENDQAQEYTVDEQVFKKIMGFLHARCKLSFWKAKTFSQKVRMYKEGKEIVPKIDVLKARFILKNTRPGSEEARTAIEFLSALWEIATVNGQYITYTHDDQAFHFLLKIHDINYAADIFLEIGMPLNEAFKNIKALVARHEEKARLAEQIRMVEEAHMVQEMNEKDSIDTDSIDNVEDFEIQQNIATVSRWMEKIDLWALSEWDSHDRETNWRYDEEGDIQGKETARINAGNGFLGDVTGKSS